MKAVIITKAGGPDVLELREVEAPRPPAQHVLVRVRASALNRADVLQRRGAYPPPPDVPADIPGIEFAGEIVELGVGVRERRVGDRVFGIIGGGAHAELVVAHERAIAEVPASVSWEDAGAAAEAFITAHDALVSQAAMRALERVLIHAVGSGVGLAAVQLVRALGGIPYGTSRTADKIERAKTLGLEDGVALGSDLSPLRARVDEWTAGRGMNVILDLVGGDYLEAGVEVLAMKGRLMVIGTVAGARSNLPLRRVLTHRLTIRGTVLRSRPLEERIAATRAFADEVVPLLARGDMRPVIDARFPLADIRAAHERLEGNETFGKVAILVDA